MPLYLIEAPDNDDVLTLADAKAHLRVDGNEEDALIEGYVAAAIANLDGRDGWLGRALGEQAWELRLSSFSGNAIEVPLPPLIEVEGVSYYDTNNMLQTLPSSTYDVIGIGGFGKARRFVLANGQEWEQSDDTVLSGVRKTNPAVSISPGLLGVWYLRVDGVNTRAKVRRTK